MILSGRICNRSEIVYRLLCYLGITIRSNWEKIPNLCNDVFNSCNVR